MNLVVSNSSWLPSDISALFGDEKVTFVLPVDLSELAVDLNAFKSRSQARKAGRVGPIPKGWTVWKANKTMRIFIWNPDSFS